MSFFKFIIQSIKKLNVTINYAIKLAHPECKQSEVNSSQK